MDKSVIIHSVKSQVLPLSIGRAIIPNNCVAEIVSFEKNLNPVDNSPNWYMGNISWRGTELPLVSIDAMVNKNNEMKCPKDEEFKRFIVINSDRRVSGVDFVAFPLQGVPRIFESNNNNLYWDKNNRFLKRYKKINVTIEYKGEKLNCFILDIEFIDKVFGKFQKK